MSYEEWSATLFPFEAKTLTRKEIFQAGAASRDAEIARLKTVPMRYRRMAFNAQLQDEIAELVAFNAQLQDEIAELVAALRAHDENLLAPYQWQPIETAPKGELIAIWIVGTNKNGQKWSDEEGECWLYCYHDNICGDWRTTRPSGHLRCVPDRFVTHWMPLPSAAIAKVRKP